MFAARVLPIVGGVKELVRLNLSGHKNFTIFIQIVN